MTSYWWLLGHVTLLFYLTTRSRDFSITFFIIYFYYCLLIFEETILVCVFYMAFIYVLLLLCILLCTHGYYMFTCHCCQRFIYVNKLSCTTDEGLTTENFGSYHYTILHQNRTLSSFLLYLLIPTGYIFVFDTVFLYICLFFPCINKCFSTC